MGKVAIFLSGPIGVGKTTLGRAVATQLGGCFLDGDDFSARDKRWFEDVLTSSRALLAAILAAPPDLVIVAKPLRRRDWFWFRQKLAAHCVPMRCVTLAARLDGILDPARGRDFSAAERHRIVAMIAEGYAARPFSDATLATDCADLSTTTAALIHEVQEAGLLADEGPGEGSTFSQDHL